MFRFTPSTIPHTIFVVGCGGTGSRLIPMLTQFIRSITRLQSPMGWLNAPRIVLIDDDVVEDKNLLRQNFIAPDVGKPKAAVLATRYGRAFGVNISAFVGRLGPDNTGKFPSQCAKFEEFVQNLSQSEDNRNGVLSGAVMLIMCVDSAKSRRQVLSAFLSSIRIEHLNSAFVIDAGNEDTFGQVSYFTPNVTYTDMPLKEYDVKTTIYKPMDITFMPMDLKYYMTLEDGVSTRSCADLDQTLAINSIMATMILSTVQNYYFRRPMDYNQQSFSMDGGGGSIFNTLRDMRSRCILNHQGDYADREREENALRCSSAEGGAKYPLYDILMGKKYYNFNAEMYIPLLREQEKEKKRQEVERKKEEAAARAAAKAAEDELKSKQSVAERLKILREKKEEMVKAEPKLVEIEVPESLRESLEPAPAAFVAAPAPTRVQRVRRVQELPSVAQPEAIEAAISEMEAEASEWEADNE